MDRTTDSAIVERVLAGQRDAFRALVERYFETVRMVALAKTANAADAEDVAQDTFLKAYETLGTLRSRDRLAPWLVTIARNQAVSIVRKRERERRNAPDAVSTGPVLPDHERREMLDAVARQVEALPVNLREVVLLHYFEGLKCREIGERLDLNTNAVVKRLTRGRELLGDRLLREWGSHAREDVAGIGRIMGAIIVLPTPDWGAQAAALGTAGSKPAAVVSVGGVPLSKAGIGALSLVVAATIAVTFFVVRSAVEARSVPDKVVADYEEPRAYADTSAHAGDEEESDTRVLKPSGRVAIPLPQPPERAEVGFIAGTVRDSAGAPLQGVAITASSRSAQGKTMTDPNGTFRANISAAKPQIAAGEVRPWLNVLASKSGYVTLVTRDVPMGTADMQLELLRPAVVRGQVVDAATGAPVPRFSLRIDGPGPIVRPDTGESVASHWREVHDRDGQFTLDGDFGIQTLDVVASGYVGATLDLGLAQDEAEEGIVIPLDRGAAIAGFVFDEESQSPLDKAHIAVRAEDKSVRQDYGDLTDESGAFAFEGVSSTSSVQLEVWKLGFRRQFVPVDLAATDVPIKIYLDRGGTVRGRVRYQGGPPPESHNANIEDGYCLVRVSVMEDGGGQGQYSYVQPDGTYEVTGLEPGLYMANAFYWPYKPHVNSNSMSRLVMVREGQTTTLNLSYDDEGGDLAVLLGDSDVAYEATVELRSPVQPDTILTVHAGRAGQSGTFPRTAQFSKLAPGEYLLRVYVPGHEEEAVEEPVRVSEGQTIELAVDLGSGGDTGGETAENLSER